MDVSKTRSGTVRISEATLRQAEDEALEKAMKIKKQARRSTIKFAVGQPRKWERRPVKFSTFTLRKWVPVGPRQLVKTSTSVIDPNVPTSLTQQIGIERPFTAPITRRVTAALSKESRDTHHNTMMVDNDMISNETSGMETEEVSKGSEGRVGGNDQILNNDLRKRTLDVAFNEKSNHDLPSNKELRTETNKITTTFS